MPHSEPVVDRGVVDKSIILDQPFAGAVEESSVGEVKGDISNKSVVAGYGVGVVVVVPHPPTQDAVAGGPINRSDIILHQAVAGAIDLGEVVHPHGVGSGLLLPTSIHPPDGDVTRIKNGEGCACPPTNDCIFYQHIFRAVRCDPVTVTIGRLDIIGRDSTNRHPL